MATERVNEFQHFIPQFILKNFAHEYSPPKPSSKSAQRRRQKSQKKSQQPPFHRGDPILNIIDLKDDEPKISESLVKRTFGLLDMYADHSRQVNRQYIEKELGKLESQAGRTIARIKKALDSGDIAIWLTRSERDALRKFMFIMKYRGLGFFRRFHGNETGEYVEDDKAKFKEYMQKSGYSKPVDVWLKSIKTILELKMDVEGRWRHRLVESIYPDDAMWFIMHTEFYYLALCTPEDSEVEFFVTENCFNVHEGPNSTMLNPESGEYEVRAWTSYHEFNPVSPTLMLVLRSALLPDEEEDANENIREWRRRMFESSAEGHFDPERAQSLLADLPVRKARNSYSRVTSEGIKLLDGEDGSRRENHRFEFTFFKISTAHLLKINDIFLENAYYTSEIAFRSLESMKRSIEHYLQLPQESGFKNIQQRGKDPQIIYLKKLEKIAHSLDSEVRLIYSEIHSLDSAVRLLDEMAMMMAKKMKDEVKDTISHPTEFMQLYSELGGSFATLHKDLEQAEKMRIFRVKIDVWTKGLPEHDRQEVRNSLRDIYCQHTLTRRLWLYLKVGIRAMSLGTPQSWSKHIFSPEIMHGPEDVIVKAKKIVRPQSLGLLLYYTVLMDIQHRRDPELHPGSGFTLDRPGAEKLRNITNLTFSHSGTILNCGIKSVEEKAAEVSMMFRLTKAYANFRNPAWDTEQNIEVLTRTFVRDEMGQLLGAQLPSEVFLELTDVIFNVVYPSYPRRVYTEDEGFAG